MPDGDFLFVHQKDAVVSRQPYSRIVFVDVIDLTGLKLCKTAVILERNYLFIFQVDVGKSLVQAREPIAGPARF